MRAVCFDLGGVLIQIHHTWDEALAASGVKPASSLDEIGPLADLAQFGEFQRGSIASEEYLAALAEHLGGTSAAEALAVHRAVTRDAYPGVEPR